MSSNRVGGRPILFGCAWCRTYHLFVDLREDALIGVDIVGVFVDGDHWRRVVREDPLHINNQVHWVWGFRAGTSRHGNDFPSLYLPVKSQTLHLGPVEGSDVQTDGTTFLYLLW